MSVAIVTGSDSGIGKRTAVLVNDAGTGRETPFLAVPLEEFQDKVAALCRPEAAYTTGSSWVIDGGMMLMAAQANELAEQ